MSSNVLKSSEILNDDILTIILKQLEIKQLLRLERVSKQFAECVNQALKRKTGLRIGPKTRPQSNYCGHKSHSIKRSNITKAIAMKGNSYMKFFDLIGSKEILSSMLRRCPNIKSLFLRQCSVDSDVIQLIYDNCSQLQCLYLSHIHCYNYINLWQNFGQLFSKRLIHFYTDFDTELYDIWPKRQYLSTEIDIFVKELTLLEKLYVGYYGKCLNKLINYLPKTIRSIHFDSCDKIDENSIKCLIDINREYLTELKIVSNCPYYTSDREMFDSICDNFKLKKFSFEFRFILPTNSMNKLSQLSDLQQLSISYFLNSFNNLTNNITNIDTNSLLSLRVLNFKNCKFNPKMLSEFSKQFPNVKELSLNKIYFMCECNYTGIDNCIQCYSKCLSFISQLKKLKYLCYYYDLSNESEPTKTITAFIEGLVEFKSLTTLEIPWFRFNNLLEMLINICNNIIENQTINKAFILKIDEIFYDRFICNPKTSISIPNNLRIFKL